MLKQSIALNNLSCASEGHINSSGGKLGTRFLTRFPDHEKACSFRNKIMYLFNRELTDSLVGTFRDYMQPSSSLPIHSNNKHFTTEKQSKKRKLETQFKQVKVTTDMIAEQASFVDLDDMIIFLRIHPCLYLTATKINLSLVKMAKWLYKTMLKRNH